MSAQMCERAWKCAITAIMYSHVAVADWDKETKDRVSLLSIGVQCHMQTHKNTLNLVRVSVLTLLQAFAQDLT